jgi:hypothetical protein
MPAPTGGAALPARPVGRRQLLVLAGVAAAELAGVFGQRRSEPAAPGPQPPGGPSLGDRLSALVDGHAPAHALGTAYLSGVPGEADRTVLTGLLLAALALPERVAPDDDALRGLLARRVTQDFADGTTCLVDGWLLSRTECRLAALAAVESARPEVPRPD